MNSRLFGFRTIHKRAVRRYISTCGRGVNRRHPDRVSVTNDRSRSACGAFPNAIAGRRPEPAREPHPRRRLPRARDAERPRLSPDGERVAFVRTLPEDEESYRATIYTVAADGSDDPRRFTVREGVDSRPRWSPSGDRLAFVSTRGDDDRRQLWVVPTDGDEAQRVTNVPGAVVDPTWSPDGSRIAFVQPTRAAERDSGVDCAVTAGGGEESDLYERETPDPRVVDRLTYRGLAEYKDGARNHVYVADLGVDDAKGRDSDTDADAAGSDVTRVTDGPYDHTGVDWGDDSTLYWGTRRPIAPDDADPDADPVDPDDQ
jgi:dipeptidyl aminopeptidase/acylaminoacyl peptidase